MRIDILKELQVKATRELEEKRQKIIKQELDQQARIKELKSKKYSLLPAKLSVRSRSEGFSNAIIITSIDNEPLLLERVVVNNRSGVKGCDQSGFLEYMETGDARQIPVGSCGDRIVKVEVYTNRGSFSYQFK